MGDDGTTTARGRGRNRLTHVTGTRWVTPHLLRVTVTGDDLADYVDNGTDQHVALLFHHDDVVVPDPMTEEAMAQLWKFARPRMRRYTIRRFDPVTREVDFDFVIHDKPGPASAWAVAAKPGDALRWWGPTEAWHPRPDTGHFVLAGDETALPTIDATLRQIPAGPQVTVVAEISGPEDECYLDEVAHRATVIWVHRRGEPGSGSPRFMASVRCVDLGPGPVQVWGASEYSTVQALRRWFLGEQQMTRQDAFLVTYWIHGQRQDQRYETRDRVEVAKNRRRDPEGARRFLRSI